MKPLRVLGLTLLTVVMVVLTACSAAVPASLTVLAAPQQQAAQVATTMPTTAAVATLPVATVAPVATSATAPTAPVAPTVAAPTAVAPSAPVSPTVAAAGSAGRAIAGDLQGLLEQVYTATNESVVGIQVTSSGAISGTMPMPNMPGNPRIPGNALPQQAEGSGFVWDSQGNIVTNNHVVEGADKIAVTFYDGATVAATLVGRDPDTDLAVIKVDPKGLDLSPVTVGDSTQIQVGQFVVAIGNPFGLANSMSFGIISAVGRSLPADASAGFLTNGPGFTIPDIIQTDAPINPGNSGGVLVDLQGQLLGVTSAIESPVRANSGVGFAIPATLVKNVVPSLIQTGKAQHPYVGISGVTLNPDVAQAMKLNASQRGALVIQVSPGGPAEQAGLRASNSQATINGEQYPVGGDVIVRIDNQPVQKFDDLTAYLARSTKVGQSVTLTVLRNGQQTTVNLKLGDRPAQAPAQAQPALPRRQATPENRPPETPQAPTAGATAVAPTTAPATAAPTAVPPTAGAATVAPSAGATPAPLATGQPATGRPWLGVTITALTPELTQAMKLDQNQQGALVLDVATGSPAETAGLQGGTQDFATSAGNTVQIGGDVIVAVNGSAITSDQNLVQVIGQASPGQKVTLTVLRNGSKLDVGVTLGTRPAQ